MMQVTDEMVRASAIACRKRQFERAGAGRAFKTRHEPLCSQCDPTIGKWHEQFPRKLADGYVQDKSGNIYLPDEAAGYFKHLGPFKPVVLPDTTPERP